MSYIDRDYYENIVLSPNNTNRRNQQSTDTNIKGDTDTVINELRKIIERSTIEYASTWLLERDNWLDFENNGSADYPRLGNGRVINVNPGVDNLGHEQRYIHMYIVLSEYKETFVGVPITNAQLKEGVPTLRNDMEVLLVDPTYKKPFKEFRCKKPSVADLRNIRGMDKKRVILDNLYTIGRTIPNTYKQAISQKIIDLFTFK